MVALFVRAIHDVDKVVDAFQAALEIVVNPAKVRDMLQDRFNTQRHQLVHYDPRRDAMGEVVMAASRDRSGIAVIVRIHHGSRSKARNNPPLAPELLSRMLIQHELSSQQARLTYDLGNDWYEARLLIPAAQLQAWPHVQVVFA